MPLTGPQTTGNLTNARWAKYLPEYFRAAMFERTYDFFASDAVVPDERMADLWRSSSINLNFISDMEPGTDTIPETLDVPSTAVRDATFQITPTSRFGLVEASELLMNSASTNYAAERYYILGKNHAETVDLVAKDKAVQGGSVNRAAARASLDAGTAGHRLARASFMNAASDLMTKKVPAFMNGKRAMWGAVLPPYALDDLLTSTEILATGEYQQASIVLANELGELGKFKLFVTPWAKTFYSAGAANASAVNTTLNGAVNALAKTMVVTANTNMTAGNWLTIGTIETANTHQSTNERVQIITVAGTTITISGEGANGGFRFDHASGVTISNADNVGTVTFGGTKSLAKVYDPLTGEFGEVLPPEKVGALKHIYQLGWKWYGQYERWNESMLLRQEVSFSRDA
jgi:N4-gp56 family major capsid protein